MPGVRGRVTALCLIAATAAAGTLARAERLAAATDLQPSDGVRHCSSHTDDLLDFHVVIAR